jgi:hypothetical protein
MKAKQIESYLVENYGECRHNPTQFEKALGITSKSYEVDSFKLFLLIVENRPIESMHTHSYGFHTANGRELIENFQNNYYNN